MEKYKKDICKNQSQHDEHRTKTLSCLTDSILLYQVLGTIFSKASSSMEITDNNKSDIPQKMLKYNYIQN